MLRLLLRSGWYADRQQSVDSLLRFWGVEMEMASLVEMSSFAGLVLKPSGGGMLYGIASELVGRGELYFYGPSDLDQQSAARNTGNTEVADALEAGRYGQKIISEEFSCDLCAVLPIAHTYTTVGETVFALSDGGVYGTTMDAVFLIDSSVGGAVGAWMRRRPAQLGQRLATHRK
ncbi:MAG: hypothetical protein AAF447_06905 [Myxococcota bacterium]